MECLAFLLLGFLSGSIALLGFGLERLVESLSGDVRLWRFGQVRGLPPEVRPPARRALPPELRQAPPGSSPLKSGLPPPQIRETPIV